MRITAFAPGHITGLFHIQDKSRNELHTGSLGAGFSIEQGVTTHIEWQENETADFRIFINDSEQQNAVVSEAVIRLFFEHAGIHNQGRLSVFHKIKPPMASGFGTSGAGALHRGPAGRG